MDDSSAGFQGDGMPRDKRPQQPGGRKKGTACARCRAQKVRCDDGVDSCGNCARAGQRCVRAKAGNNAETIGQIAQMEARLRSLENSLRRLAPEELDKAPVVDVPAYEPGPAPSVVERGTSWQGQPPQSQHGLDELDELQPPQSSFRSPGPGPPEASPSAASSTQIQPSEPLAHEVGLLSLANSTESKYLGPSSGVSFARLIFSAVPQSQGLRSSWVSSDGHTRNKPAQAEPFPLHWTSDVDLQHFVDAYFETYQPLYPFLDEDVVAERLESLVTKQSPTFNSTQMPQLAEVEASLPPLQSVQIFLVIALGARILEGRLATDFQSERYLATAMQRINNLVLHDNIEGLQAMLLLALSGFCFENGPNAWFLTSSIIASCLDLGLQRRWAPPSRMNLSRQDERRFVAERNLRSGIFWSAYSLERTLAVVLGRPLTLRDEAIDVEFPGAESAAVPPQASRRDSSIGLRGQQPNDETTSLEVPKRARLDSTPYAAAQIAFTFDQITAEIKLMLYRVVNSPSCFPWPTDQVTWQAQTHKRCDELHQSLLRVLKWRSRRRVSDAAIRSLELKYHHCLMLLHRPSPAMPRPTFESLNTCYSSAMKTIQIYADLYRFSKLPNTWLTAHTVFVSGITFLYCLWTSPRIKAGTDPATFASIGAACANLLRFISKSWSVAADAVVKFERLVQLTTNSWQQQQQHQQQPQQQSTDVEADQPPVYPSQPASQHHTSANGPGDGGPPPPPCVFGAGVNSGQNGYAFEPQLFLTELGDMSTWFDLNWMMGAEGETSFDLSAFSVQ